MDADADSSEETEGMIKCHHYHLKLPAPSNVWVEVGVASPGIEETDVLLFVFRTNKDEDVTEFITYTQHKVENVNVHMYIHMYICTYVVKGIVIYCTW